MCLSVKTRNVRFNSNFHNVCAPLNFLSSVCESLHLYVCRGYVRFEETPGILDPNEFREFWISWKDGRIAVGRGRIPLLREILAWTDPKHMTVSYLSMGMYNNEGHWEMYTVPGKDFILILQFDLMTSQRGVTCLHPDLTF